MATQVLLVSGTRPNFIKLAPLYHALNEYGVDAKILHTGQHYDRLLSSIFFQELKLPEPHYNLNVPPSSQLSQISIMMAKFEEMCNTIRPEMVVVVGDVNSTLACSIASSKLGIPLSHVESGLRSFDREMPEETNRIIVDHISDHCFTTTEIAGDNLKNEGIDPSRINFVGNVMIDCLVMHEVQISKSNICQKLGLIEGGFDVLTLHRPSNVNSHIKLKQLLEQFNSESFGNEIIFPVHPRTMKVIENYGLLENSNLSNIQFIEPLGYIDFIQLISKSAFVWTDSGGIQEETTYLGIPCFTIRDNTERPETIEFGTNRLISINEISESLRLNHQGRRNLAKIPLWDGRASYRIAEKLSQILSTQS